MWVPVAQSGGWGWGGLCQVRFPAFKKGTCVLGGPSSSEQGRGHVLDGSQLVQSGGCLMWVPSSSEWGACLKWVPTSSELGVVSLVLP